MEPDTKLRRLALEDLHVEAGARFGAFAGWSMPLSYPPGVMQEHLHTRAHAGLFDISHMKLVALSGAGAQDLIARLCPLQPAEMAEGQARYTFFLNEDAGIIDDLIVTRRAAERFMIVANAGNADQDIAHILSHAAGFDCHVEPLERIFLALQGPEAEQVLADAGIAAAGLAFMHAAEPQAGWFLSRSGYTGEDGFEIGLPVEDGRDLAARLSGDARCRWTGLAARDSLRLEAGLCLHGQDIDAGTTPVEAGLLWAIPKALRGGGSHLGAAALARAIEAGASRRRVGLKPEGRQPVRAGTLLYRSDGSPAGGVTSGGFGPSAGHPVAMGYVDAREAAAGTKLLAEVRGKRLPVFVHPLPFIPHRYRKGRTI